MKKPDKKTDSVIIGFALAVLGAAMLCACAAPMPGTGAMDNANGREIFRTPDDALSAFMAAARDNNKAELRDILGPNAGKIIYSGDPVADENSRARLVAAYDAGHRLEAEGDNKEILILGEEEWPAPIPLVRADGGWQFDTEAGEQEILNRRIGRNELNVIATCRAFVEAQREYGVSHSVNGKPEYATRFMSHDGKHDGLYWSTAEGEDESPLGPLFATAEAEGYENGPHGHHEPYHGYYFKILKHQGPHAAGGAKEYIKNGHMTGGFALLAFPARYGDSGVMSFMVNENGFVYEKDLGPDTAQIARQIHSFDPDMSWQLP